MMGELPEPQGELLYDFNLEKHIPEDHLLRRIDQFLDFRELRRHLKPYYSTTGRPSVDPELMLRMLIIGYCYGIRSERRLCEEVHFNLAYRWFCRLGLEGEVPDHSTFSKNRHGRFRDSEAFRFVFEEVLSRCIQEGLVGGEGFAVDASVVKADASKQRHKEDDDDWGGSGSYARPVREYLASLDEVQQSGKPAKKVSLTDPAARWTCAPGGPAFYGYSTNYLVDIDRSIIVDVEATPALRTDEVHATRTMLERVEERFAMKPHHLIGDTNYGTGPVLDWLVQEKAIEPHVPVWDKPRRDGTFEHADFKWDPQANEYRCPKGHPLRTRGTLCTDNTVIYLSRVEPCRHCEWKYKCCPNAPHRKIRRSIFEDSRQHARDIARTPSYRQSRKDRKKVEMLFAHLKRIMKLDRLRLRGPSGARDEFLLAATVQNLRKLAKYAGRSPPLATVTAPA